MDSGDAPRSLCKKLTVAIAEFLAMRLTALGASFSNIDAAPVEDGMTCRYEAIVKFERGCWHDIVGSDGARGKQISDAASQQFGAAVEIYGVCVSTRDRTNRRRKR